VYVTLEELTVLDDHEEGFEPGDGDAEVALEQRVSVAGALVDERKLADRTPALAVLAEGEVSAPIEVFSSPVPDDVDVVHVAFEVIEVDRYRRFGLAESTFVDASEPLASFDLDVMLDADATYALAGAGAVGTVRVRVETLD
jgi:hypothetical protein